MRTIRADNTGGQCARNAEVSLAHAMDLVERVALRGRPLIDQQLIQLKLNKMHMLTEALRSFVLRIAWEHDEKIHSANAGLAMNFSTDVIQDVTELYMDIRGAAGCRMDHHADKLVRDSFIWSHLAGDSVQRMKVARRLGR